jgi:catechol 2,3-dioxygenase
VSSGGSFLRASLYQLALDTPDPELLAHFYTRALGLRFATRGHALVGVGRHRRLQLQSGPAKRLSAAYYAVEDREILDRLSERLGQADVTFTRGPESDVFADAVCFLDPDGNKLVFGVGLQATAAVPEETSVGAWEARLQHLVVASADASRLLQFYRSTVGFKVSDVVLDDKGVMRTAFLCCSGEHHSLAIFAAADSRLDHFCFETTDWNRIRDWADHFAAEHIPLKWGPGRHGPGNNLFVFIHDSDHNWVEISAELEQVSPDRQTGVWPHEQRTLNSWGTAYLRS